MKNKTKIDIFKTIAKNVLMKLSPSVYQYFNQLRHEYFLFPKNFRNHLKNLEPKHTVIDLGANVGIVSRALAKTGAKVIAFEPNDKAFKILSQNVKHFSNIKIRNEAAGIRNHQTKLFFHVDAENDASDLTQSSSLLFTKNNVSSDNFQIVNEIDFALFLENLNQEIELIKIDIEGYEIFLLEHLLKTNCFKYINAIYVETHENSFHKTSYEIDALKLKLKKAGLEQKIFFNWI